MIDLRSDTVTLPTEEMRNAMATAVVGDDVMGEDPTVNQLEKMAADLAGMEASLFVASGTMGNLVSVLAHCDRGDEVVLGDKSHLYRGEAGGISVLGSVSFKPLQNQEDGTIDINQLFESISPDDFHFSKTKVIALENTQNHCGGAVLLPEYVEKVSNFTNKHGLLLHMDGARIFNAAVYLGLNLSTLLENVDSVSICLSKGLSAPVGSLVCGSDEFISKARRIRKMLGGGMRQAGIIAAAGIIALEKMVDRLSEDHINAKKLAVGLSKIPNIGIDIDQVQTNIIFFEIKEVSELKLASLLENKGVKIYPRKPKWRIVTHSGITSTDVDIVLDAFKKSMDALV
ncbi:MAG: low-specificity L-threonine aldolase [Chloroflexi bacterium]|nr:low-specificity L-threonine aldolase [Chloroflexota bacterium]MQG05001.1 low-specificity L-threonine aldolase [SAR202 cluster bacterium]|tara:strand:+ start:7836 stop:8864 length:1029 start_codon:yes stop_codon:yes gene_type:complete